MDYQEKLRLAKEALNSNSYDKRTIEYIFPELKESKDERIRNFLISKMKEVGNVWKEYSSKDIIAWLEKQGEQKANEIHPIFRVGDYIKNKKTGDKVVIEQLNVESEVYYHTSYDGAAVNHSDFPFSKQDEWELIGQKVVEQNHTDNAEPKFKAGDWVVPNNGEPRVFRVEERGWPDSIISCSLGNHSVNTFTLDKQYHLWTIKDAKDGDVLVASDGSIFIFKEIVDCGCKHYIALEKDGKTININDNLEHFWESVRGVKPSTKEQRDLLFTKMKEAGAEWDAEKKELKKVESKSAWSEDDEKYYQGCLHVMNIVLNAKPYPYYNDYLWLKSLKERYTWKPSDEQMNFLWKYAEQNNYDGAVLTSLFRDLEKLKEE